MYDILTQNSYLDHQCWIDCWFRRIFWRFSVSSKALPYSSYSYCASKYAVQGLTMAIRKELVATPLRVSLICPGAVETEFSIVRFGGNSEMAKKVYEGFQPLTGEDIADNIAYVASRPSHVQISDLVVYPTSQAAVCSIHKEIKS
jgi:3-hydroxy acid dehydrogenase / malonic semialdehyde reductase